MEWKGPARTATRPRAASWSGKRALRFDGGLKRREPEAQAPDKKHGERKSQGGVSVVSADLIGELLRGRLALLASLMSVTIFAASFRPRAVQRRLNHTQRLMVPASAMSPMFFPTGVASPVRFDSSAAVFPLAISASTGNCAPA